MKLRKQRRYHDNVVLTRGVLSKNPVLYYGFALPYIIVAGTTLRNGVALSIAMLFALVPAETVASMFGKQIPKFARVVIYTVTSMAFLQLSAMFIRYISPNIFDSIGIYFPLIVINSILLTRTESIVPEMSPLQALLDGFIQSMGFALVMCLIAGVRELLGYGTLWGVPFDIPTKLPGILLPFAGFILIGFLAAFGKYIDRLIKKFIYHGENRAEA